MISKRFPLIGLLTSQFFGAFNDNAWKLIVFTLATRPLLGDADFELSSQTIATLSMLVFLLPMMLFSIPAGTLADRFCKRRVMIGSKLLEVALMAAAAFSLYTDPQHLWIPFILLGGMGLQSAFFGPSKYGILPEILPEEKLSKGNGLLEMWTMIAIIAGTGMGPALLAADDFGAKPHLTWVGAGLLALLALVGFAASFAVPRGKVSSAATPNTWKGMLGAWKAIRADNALYLAFLGSVIYWSVISLLGQNVLVYAKSLVIGLEKGEVWQGLPPAAYGLGITLGAFFASRVSGARIELGLIPLGAIGFSASSLLLGILQPEMGGTVAILIVMGISSGLVIVPLHTLIQSRAQPGQRGAIIALGNFVDIGGMMAGSLFAAVVSWLGVNIGEMLILSALFVVLATIFAIRTLPAALVRFCFIVLTKTCYRLKVRGLKNIPASGPFVVVSNHISCIDALFVMASLDRPVHFVMNEYYYNRWWLNPLARLLETIPVSSSSNPKLLVEGMRRAGEYLDNGEIVCIFPEGQVTHTGVLLPFQRGVELIVRGRSCPIVPLYIDGVWGSIFSFKGGRFFKKWPEHRACSLTVTYGDPFPPSTSSLELRRAIQELEHKAWMAREEQYMPLPHTFIRHARHKPWAPALCDQSTAKMSRIKVLAAAIVLGNLLKDSWKEEEAVGLLLPPSIPGVICNLAATLSCRPVINLNFTTGAGPLASAIRQARIRKVYTSRAFLEKFPVAIPEGIEVVYLEDIRKKATRLVNFKAFLKAFLYDPEQIEQECGASRKGAIEDILTIIFTSGSTGEPKGVVLSHFNLHANIDGVAQVVPGNPRCHRLVHALPFFHSFGYMMMWLGLNHKHTLILHPNPLDFGAIGELAWKMKATLMMTTPTFLRGYMKRVLSGQFGTLKCVLTGAEKLPESLAKAFELQYGLRPIEGYGATECAPVIATSSLNVREQGICQLGTLPGTVGKPLPGILLRVVHPETLEELPFGAQGLLLAKGPNVMQGYLEKPELTREAIKDGWYVTGDIASLNQEGFVTITDRLSRFSKIGGEMVPHGRVEEYLHQAAKADQQLFAVTAIPDQQKGECLAVVHTVQPENISGILKQLSELGIPNLYIPKSDCFIHVEALPMLGSGKLDLKAVKAIALQSLTA